MRRWVVDGMNVIGSRPDGWWRDRRGAMRRLVVQLAELSRETGDDVTVVFDGRPFALPERGSPGVRVLFATRRGPGAADDRIAELLREEGDARGAHVVTSDRDLAARAEKLGARVTTAGAFARRLDSPR